MGLRRFSILTTLLEGCNQVSGWDASQFMSLLSATRSAIGNNKLQTAAVSVNGITGISGGPLDSFAGFAQTLDYINLMTCKAQCISVRRLVLLTKFFALAQTTSLVRGRIALDRHRHSGRAAVTPA